MNISNLVFDYGWRKPISIQFNQNKRVIELAFDAYKGEEVNHQQQVAYEHFLNNKTLFEQKIEKLLNEYIALNKFEKVEASPTVLMFKRDGSFGLLCDCSWDIENGIAIILSPTEEVTLQDNFL